MQYAFKRIWRKGALMMDEYLGCFNALRDETRLKIIWLLFKFQTSLCVCELMDSLTIGHYNVSRHVKILKDAKLITTEKIGRWVYCELRKPRDSFTEMLLNAVSLIPEKYCLKEIELLRHRLDLRKDGKCVVGVSSNSCHD
jgi:ArsR family transcriptional regulator